MTLTPRAPLSDFELNLSAAWNAVRLGSIDRVTAEARAARLMGRSIKHESKLAALQLAVSCVDLTTLEGADTPERVRALCARARRPDPFDASLPAVAAVCVYPELVAVAREALTGSTVRVASVAGAFPSGQSDRAVRLADIRAAVAAGADEIDIVLNRRAFLSGRYSEAFDDIAASKEAAGSAHIKTILETGELGSLDNVRRASLLALAAGSDVIKTSTGKIATAATPPVALVMAEALRDVAERTGIQAGLKLAGGIRTAKQAWGYLALIHETLGPQWLTPTRFRFGASALLNDLVRQWRFQRDGRYARGGDLPVD